MRNETLQDLIEARGLGLKATAQAARIGRTSLWRWLHGLAVPRHAQAAALGAALGVTPDQVIEAAERSSERSGAPA